MSNHGGKREGAGRPAPLGKKITLPFRVYPETIPEIKKIQEEYERRLKNEI